MPLLAAAHPLVHVNATLNATATVLLVVGWWLIKKRHNVDAHKWAMLAAFGVSCLFLLCYSYYHFLVGRVDFTHPGPVKYIYYLVLGTHIPLAFTVPVLAIWQIYLGLRAVGCCQSAGEPADNQELTEYMARHRRLARWAYPIWLYVSVTGVVVYVMLYHLWPPLDL